MTDDVNASSPRITCPSCGSTKVELAHSSTGYDGRLTEFYRCRDVRCDGAFRVTYIVGKPNEVAPLWSKLTDRK